MKFNWLHRDVVRGPFMLLCTTEAEFTAVKKHMGANDSAEFPGAGWAKVRVYTRRGELTCVVLLGDVSKCTPIEITGLLTHEAVHVWQEFCEHIGERAPSAEFEAYSIQSIAQRLWCAYIDQVVKAAAKPPARRRGVPHKSHTA